MSIAVSDLYPFSVDICYLLPIFTTNNEEATLSIYDSVLREA